MKVFFLSLALTICLKLLGIFAYNNLKRPSRVFHCKIFVYLRVLQLTHTTQSSVCVLALFTQQKSILCNAKDKGENHAILNKHLPNVHV